MNIRELFNLIDMIPEAGLQYIVNRLVPPNELTKDEKKTLASWITKNTFKEYSDINRQILFLLDYKNIRWISNPTEDEMLKVVYEDPYLIEFIKNPSENVQLAAIRNTAVSPGRLFSLITNPSRQVWMEVIKEKPESILSMSSDDLEYQLTALELRPAMIMNTTVNWLDEARRFAFQKDPVFFPWLYNPTEDECWIALHEDFKFIKNIKNPTPEMKAFAIIVS